MIMIKVREWPGFMVFEFEEKEDAIEWMLDRAEKSNLMIMEGHNGRYVFKHRVIGSIRVFTIMEN